MYHTPSGGNKHQGINIPHPRRNTLFVESSKELDSLSSGVKKQTRQHAATDLPLNVKDLLESGDIIASKGRREEIRKQYAQNSRSQVIANNSKREKSAAATVSVEALNIPPDLVPEEDNVPCTIQEEAEEPTDPNPVYGPVVSVEPVPPAVTEAPLIPQPEPISTSSNSTPAIFNSHTEPNVTIDVGDDDENIKSIDDVDALMNKYAKMLEDRIKKSAHSAIFEAQLSNFRSQHGPYQSVIEEAEDDSDSLDVNRESAAKRLKIVDDTPHFWEPMTHERHRHHDHAHAQFTERNYPAIRQSRTSAVERPKSRPHSAIHPSVPLSPSQSPVHPIVVITDVNRVNMEELPGVEELSPNTRRVEFAAPRPSRAASARPSVMDKAATSEQPTKHFRFASQVATDLPTSLVAESRTRLFQGSLSVDGLAVSDKDADSAYVPFQAQVSAPTDWNSSVAELSEIGFNLNVVGAKMNAVEAESYQLGDGGWTMAIERVRGSTDGSPSVYIPAPRSASPSARPSMVQRLSAARPSSSVRPQNDDSIPDASRPTSANSKARRVSSTRKSVTSEQTSILKRSASPDNSAINTTAENRKRDFPPLPQLTTTVEENGLSSSSQASLQPDSPKPLDPNNTIANRGRPRSHNNTMAPSSSSRLDESNSRAGSAGHRKRDWYRVVHHGQQRDRDPMEVEKYPNLYDPPLGFKIPAELIASSLLTPDRLVYAMETEYDEHGRSKALVALILKEIGELTDLLQLTGGLGPSEVPCRRGVLSASVGHYTDAIKDLNRALGSDPQIHDALWYRHMLRLKEGNVADALEDLDTLLDLDPDHLGAWRAKAKLCQETDRAKHAIVAYTNIIRLRTDEPDAYFQRALLFNAEHESMYASQDFAVVRRLDPENETAMRHLAIHSFERDLYDDAVKAFEKLLEANPGEATLYTYHGRCLAHLAKWEDALKDFNEAIRLSPESADVYFHRGCLLRDRNRQRAIEDFSISVLIDDTKKNADAFFQRAMQYVKLEEYDLAVADYKRVNEIDPLKAVAHLNLGTLYLNIYRDLNEALVCFGLAIKADPTSKRALLSRAELYQKLHAKSHVGSRTEITNLAVPKRRGIPMSYVDSAVADYSRAIHMRPRDHLLYLYRGRLLLRESRIQDATKDFQTAFNINSSIAQTFVQRSLVLSFQGRYPEILEEYERRKESEHLDENASALLTIAKTCQKLGNLPSAIKYLDLADAKSPHDPRLHFQRGLVLKTMSEWPLAAAEFKKCVIMEPRNAKAHYNLGLCLLRLGDLKGLNYLSEALKKDPKDFEAYITRAAFQFKNGEQRKAIEDCNSALVLEPASLRAHLLRGTCYLVLHQTSVAVRDFTKAAKIDKTCHFAFYNRAVAYQSLHDLESALRDYSIVLLHQERHFDALRNRGLLYWHRGDAQNAFLDLSKAAIGFPNDARLRGVLGLCCHKLGRHAEAIHSFDQAIKIDSDMLELYIGKGNVLAAMAETSKARREYARVLHVKPRTPAAAFNIAFTFQQDDNLKKAVHFFTAALALDSSCAYALDGRAVALVQSGNHIGALVDSSDAIRIAPWKAEYLSNRGVVHEAMCNPAEALNDFKTAAEKSKRFSLAYFNLGNAYLKQGSYEKAIQLYGKCFDLDPTDGLALLNSAIAKYLIRKVPMALEDLNVAAELCPKDGNIFFMRGHLLAEQGKLEASEADYTRTLAISPDAEKFNARADVEAKEDKALLSMQDYQHALLPEDKFMP
ncbi:hypothetical protein SmJEL517_g05131 [Synchytrium microbalum]|uniref:Uncharacterized protein n=1 Tax=Synchytrium microbalum TaxID=1806994 RepID=A0A507BXE3_9FUNG|nr:uncharacterized protein SmJEL517_g05131 [Synchytrium microbalum]TPX31519.1 hypothetical protein SmJEL517_g05131 [Synchytrium microbalum]